MGSLYEHISYRKIAVLAAWQFAYGRWSSVKTSIDPNAGHIGRSQKKMVAPSPTDGCQLFTSFRSSSMMRPRHFHVIHPGRFRSLDRPRRRSLAGHDFGNRRQRRNEGNDGDFDRTVHRHRQKPFPSAFAPVSFHCGRHLARLRNAPAHSPARQ